MYVYDVATSKPIARLDICKHANRDIIPTELMVIREWIESYLILPHIELGREGPVCPFVKPSLDSHSLWLSIATMDKVTTNEVCEVLDKVYEWFVNEESKRHYLKTLLVAIPNVTGYDAEAVIESAHFELKERFINSGFMLGQFYPEAKHTGLWNGQFRPFRSPIPMLGIRSMVSGDLAFLSNSSNDFAAYRKFYGHNVPDKSKSLFEEALNRFS